VLCCTKNQKSLEPKGVESENVAPVATFPLQLVAVDVVKSLIRNFSISVGDYDRPKEDKAVFAGVEDGAPSAEVISARVFIWPGSLLYSVLFLCGLLGTPHISQNYPLRIIMVFKYLKPCTNEYIYVLL